MSETVDGSLSAAQREILRVARENPDFSVAGVAEATGHRVPLVDAINKRSKTWRELSAEEKDYDANSARQLILKHPTLLKRPLLEVDDDTILVGYKDGDYDKL